MSSMLRAPRKLRAAISVVASLMLVLAMAGGVAAATGRNISVDHGTAATDAVPLTVTLYKQICPDYAHVPANAHGSPNDIGEANSVLENSTDYHAGSVYGKPVAWSNSNAAGCVAAPGWTFQFKNGQNGGVISPHMTGADGSVTVALNDVELALARGTTGLWVLEVTNPSAPFGEIRCYNDAINDDNLEQIKSVPDSMPHVFCFAYNVALYPALSIVKSITSGDPFLANGTIAYKYTITNTGNVTLSGPFSVSDTKITGPIACGSDSLAPLATTTCTATYTATQADVDTGFVTNVATATNGTVTSPSDSKTAEASQTKSLSIVKSITSGDPFLANGTIAYKYTTVSYTHLRA